MAFDLTVRRSVVLAALVLAASGLSACTTTEGTSALGDFQVFQEEVLDSTAVGLGLVPKDVKPDPTNARGPLVLPRDEKSLPPPEEASTAVAALPADSNGVKINSAGLTEDDLRRVRDARIVDVTSLTGRPLTESETRELTRRLKSARATKTTRSIFLPPAQYYQTVQNASDLVCLAPNGDLVAVNDPACPPEIQKALLKK
ncbi:MAG: hypothetical protein ABIO40_03875 [Devosia sp.]